MDMESMVIIDAVGADESQSSVKATVYLDNRVNGQFRIIFKIQW